MNRHRVTIAAAALHCLFAFSLHAQQRPSQKGEAYTLLRRTLANMDLSNADNARSQLTDAAKIFNARNDAFGQWLALANLAWIESALGRPNEAILQTQKAFAVIHNASRSTAPFNVESVVAFATDLGMPREANALIESRADEFKPVLLDYYLLPFTHDLYGALLTESGQLEQAEVELDKAVIGAKHLGGRYDYSIASHFGDLRFRQQRYDDARAYYRRALRGLTPDLLIVLGDLRWIEARIYDRLARLEIITGHRDEAKRWNDKALALARSSSGRSVPDTDAGLKDALHVARAMNDIAREAEIEAGIGNLQVANRKYGSAASHFERSLELFRSSKDPTLAETYTWGDLCLVYIQTGNFAAAKSVLDQARTRIGKKSELGNDMLAFVDAALRFHQREVTAEVFQASVERYIRHVPAKHSEAAEDVRRMLKYSAEVFATNDFSRSEIDAEGANPLGVTARLAAGAQQFQNRNYEDARRIWRNALEKNPGDTDRASFLLMIGLSYFREGKTEEASRWLAEGTAVQEAGIDDLQSETMVMQFVGDQAAYYNALIESLVSRGKIAQAFEATERARAFLRLLGNRRLKPPKGSGSAVVRQAEDLRRRIDHWDDQRQNDTTLAQLRAQYEALLPRLQVSAAEYASLTSVPAQQLDAIRKALPEDTTLLSYFITPFGIHAWILDKKSLDHVRLTVSASTMQRIHCWITELGETRGVITADDQRRCDTVPKEAYAALIEPLRSKIRKERLMIVPHGELHYVPFAALHDGKHYLVENYTITYVPSASTIRFLREKESPFRGTALVLGDPKTKSQPPLFGAAAEARNVAAKFHVTAKLGADAQESLLHRLNGAYDLLHIAAHGTYDSDSPLFSAIHLAEDHDENGQLNVDEIQSEIDLSGVNLVVLSACKSGKGARGGGDEVIGLTRAILYAGSPRVLATLWNISDAATPALIDTFYDALLAGAPAADALRTAQVEMLQDPDTAAPQWWAGFFLTGDP